MDAVREIYSITLEMINLLHKSDKERDEKIERLQELLNQRDHLIKNIKPPYSDEENEIGKKIVMLEPVLSKLLLNEKLSIQKDIKDVHMKKESTEKYVNPYDTFSIDGVFYDKKN